MNLMIIGGAGFVGTVLTRQLLNHGHKITVVDAAKVDDEKKDLDLRYIVADTTQNGFWQSPIAEMDGVINLAGRNIFNRWTQAYKNSIYDSRIQTTRNIVAAIPRDKPFVLLNTSAVGIYGDNGDEILTEDSSKGTDFLATVCIDWEREALKAETDHCRVVLMRFGLVLGKNGGALSKMLPPFKFFVGGPLSDGRHWFPWIHIDDLIGGILFMVEHSNIKGPVNLCAPHPVTNREFSKNLGSVLNRPAIMRVPGFLVRLVMGELGAALLSSQRASSQKLIEYGYGFQYPFVTDALQALIRMR